MEEIKAPMTDRIKHFIGNHIFMIGLVLFCVVLFFSSCGRAKAEGMIQSDRDFLHDFFGDGFTTEQWDYIEGVMDSCPYFITFQTTDGTKKAVAIMPYSSYYTYDDIYGSNDLTEPDLEIQISINNVGHNINLGTEYGRLCPYGLGNISSSSTDNPYCYYTFGIGQEVNGIGLCVVPSGQWYDDQRTWHCRWYYGSRRSITGFDDHSIANWDYDINLVNCNYNARVIRGSYTITETYPQNVFPVTYTDDSRLKFSTSLRGDGEKLLNTDLSDFVHWGPADNQDISDLVLTLDCDGTEVTVALDDTNSEIVNTKNPNYSKSLVYITPYSVFGLDEYEDVTIVKCDFTHIDVNLMGTVETDYKISCSYVLKNETAPIESEEIEYDDDTETVKVTTAEITAKNDVVNMQNYYYSYTGGGGEELVIPEGFTVKIITCVDNTSLADAINQLVSWRLLYNSFGALYDIGEAAVLEVTSISNSDDFLAFMDDEIKANAYGDYYDIVCYYYCPDAASAEVDQFYYYITSSGKLRTVNQTLADIWVECNQTSYNTYAIYDFMYTRLNDFEDKSLEAFNDMIALDRQRNSWLGTISSGVNTLNQTSLNGFADVVEAINDIDIPVPTPFDDDDILDVLGDILDALGSIINNQNSTQDGFTPLIAWVKDNQSTNGIYTWVNNMMDDNILSSTFDVFSLEDLDNTMSGDQSYLFFSTNFFKFATGTDSFDYFDRMFDYTIDFDDWNGGYTGWDSGG